MYFIEFIKNLWFVGFILLWIFWISHLFVYLDIRYWFTLTQMWIWLIIFISILLYLKGKIKYALFFIKNRWPKDCYLLTTRWGTREKITFDIIPYSCEIDVYYQWIKFKKNIIKRYINHDHPEKSYIKNLKSVSYKYEDLFRNILSDNLDYIINETILTWKNYTTKYYTRYEIDLATHNFNIIFIEEKDSTALREQIEKEYEKKRKSKNIV